MAYVHIPERRQSNHQVFIRLRLVLVVSLLCALILNVAGERPDDADPADSDANVNDDTKEDEESASKGEGSDATTAAEKKDEEDELAAAQNNPKEEQELVDKLLPADEEVHGDTDSQGWSDDPQKEDDQASIPNMGPIYVDGQSKIQQDKQDNAENETSQKSKKDDAENETSRHSKQDDVGNETSRHSKQDDAENETSRQSKKDDAENETSRHSKQDDVENAADAAVSDAAVNKNIEKLTSGADEDVEEEDEAEEREPDKKVDSLVKGDAESPKPAGEQKLVEAIQNETQMSLDTGSAESEEQPDAQTQEEATVENEEAERAAAANAAVKAEAANATHGAMEAQAEAQEPAAAATNAAKNAQEGANAANGAVGAQAEPEEAAGAAISATEAQAEPEEVAAAANAAKGAQEAAGAANSATEAQAEPEEAAPAAANAAMGALGAPSLIRGEEPSGHEQEVANEGSNTEADDQVASDDHWSDDQAESVSSPDDEKPAFTFKDSNAPDFYIDIKHITQRVDKRVQGARKSVGKMVDEASTLHTQTENYHKKLKNLHAEVESFNNEVKNFRKSTSEKHKMVTERLKGKLHQGLQGGLQVLEAAEAEQ